MYETLTSRENERSRMEEKGVKCRSVPDGEISSMTDFLLALLEYG